MEEYIPGRLQIEGGYDFEESLDDPMTLIVGGITRYRFSKSASTVEQNLRDMFGYVSVIKKQPKIKIYRKRKPKKLKQKPKVLKTDNEANLADDFEVARTIVKKAPKKRKGRGEVSDMNIMDDLRGGLGELSDLTEDLLGTSDFAEDPNGGAMRDTIDYEGNMNISEFI